MNEVASSLELSVVELAMGLEAGKDYQLLDIRPAFKMESGKIDTGPPEKFFNIPGPELHSLLSLDHSGLKRNLPVIAICNHGNQSIPAAQFLRSHGFNALSLSGGMAGWMNVVLPRELKPPKGFDQLLQFDRVGKGSLGYLLISGRDALAIDVPRKPAQFEFCAAAAGARIIGVAETHVHADYISGGANLAENLGVPYYLHPLDSSYPYDDTPGNLRFTKLTSNSEIKVGQGMVKVVHTPGHTTGSVCYLVGEEAAFTGDFIFIDSVGRPDLAGKTREWSVELYDSLRKVKRHWTDEMMIMPAHYGSEGERNPDRSIARRFGELKQSNRHLDINDESEFLAWVHKNVSTPPAEYKTIKGININLVQVSELQAEELECGRNECALGN